MGLKVVRFGLLEKLDRKLVQCTDVGVDVGLVTSK